MRIKAMSELDRMLELASHGTSRAQSQVPAERELKEGTMRGGLMKYDGQPEGEYEDAVARYKEFMSQPRPPSEEVTTMVQGFVFDDELLDSLGEAEDGGDVLDVRAIVQGRLEDFFGDAPFGIDIHEGIEEAVGEFADPILDLCDELECDSDHPVLGELIRYLDGDTIKDFVADFRRHNDMNGDMEESLEEDSNKELALKDWYQNWSHHTGGNGDELPKGWFKAELDSGITTDGIEQSELDMNWEEDRLPITDAMKDDFKSIMGNDDEETLRIAYDICRELWEAVTEAKAKPDFADIDKDGDKDEDMKKAAKDMKKEELEESPTMDTTQLINLMKNSGLSEEAIETKLTEWANTPDGAAEEEATSHGEPYENFAQSVNLSLKRYLDAEDMKVGLKEHKVDDIKEAYKKSKGE